MTTRFSCDDTESLVAFIYNELDTELTADITAHLASCAACRAEVDALGGVRRALGLWAPPMPPLRFSVVADAPAPTAPPPPSAWQHVPVWAQLAAACLAVAVSVSVANVQVHRDTTGWTITTGWMAQRAPAAGPAGNAGAAEWQPALAKLEQSLRREMMARQVSASPAAAPAPAVTSAAAVDPSALTRVRSLIQESERRQQQELALRLTQFTRDLDLQRRADLVRIDQGIGQLEGRTGAEVARQREMLNYIVRTSLRPPQ